MKTYMEWFNTDKAVLLFKWFPDEIPTFVHYLDQVSKELMDNIEQFDRNKWDNPFISLDGWINLARQVTAIIEKNKKQLANIPAFLQTNYLTDMWPYIQRIVWFDISKPYGSSIRDLQRQSNCFLNRIMAIKINQL